MATTDVQTGATARGNAPVGYAQGVSNPPNGGQVTDVDNPEPNDAPTMVPIFAPDGSFGEVPLARLHDAMNAGGKRAEFMVSPDGKTGYIPSDRVQDAVKAGAKFGSPDAQTSIPKDYGFTAGNVLHNVGTGLEQIGQGVVRGLSDIGGAILPQKLGGDPLNNLSLVHDIVDPMQADFAKAKDAATKGQTPQEIGYAIASALPVIGPYAANLGEQAGTGDVGGALARGATQYLGPKAASASIGVGARLAKRIGLPENLYESSLKPSTTLSQARRGNLVSTGLENEIPVSKQGLRDIGTAIENLNQAVNDTIAADPTRPISPGQAAQNLASVRSKFAAQVNPQSDLNAIDAARDEFLDQFRSQPGGAVRNMTAQDAQAMKQGTYRALGKKSYGELKGASIEAQKALARGLKEEIANQFPELKNLNAQESKLLDLQPALERAVNRSSNHQLIGIGTPIAASAGEALTGSTSAGAVVGAMKMVLDNPFVKSKLAIALSKAAKIPIGQAAARVQAYSSTLGAYAGATQATSGGQTATQ